MVFSSYLLNRFLLYIITPNPQISRERLNNLQKILEKINPKDHESDHNTQLKLLFLKEFLKFRLSLTNINKFSVSHSIMQIVSRPGTIYQELSRFIPRFIKEQAKHAPLLESEIPLIHEQIRRLSQHQLLTTIGQTLRDKLDEFLDESYMDDSEQLINEIFEIVSEMQKEVSAIRICDSIVTELTLSRNKFRPVLHQLLDELKTPSLILSTGLKLLNEMLGQKQGFEAGRLYVFLGGTGRFKSGILLNILGWIKRYNDDYEAKDNRRPVALYITQENTIRETFERFFNFVTIDKSATDYNAQEIEEFMNDYLNDKGIEIVFQYYPNRAISTRDLDSIVDRIESEGRRVICLIHDYLKRIAPASNNYNRDERLRLSDITNEFRSFAHIRNIPVITAHQLNRQAYSVLEQLDSPLDTVMRNIGGAQIGECYGILENADWVSVINKHPKEIDGRQYIAFKLIKSRMKLDTSIRQFFQPFKEIDSMRIAEDVELDEPLAVTDIAKLTAESLIDKINDTDNHKTKTYDIVDMDDIEFEI